MHGVLRSPFSCLFSVCRLARSAVFYPLLAWTELFVGSLRASPSFLLVFFWSELLL